MINEMKGHYYFSMHIMVFSYMVVIIQKKLIKLANMDKNKYFKNILISNVFFFNYSYIIFLT